MNEWILEIVRRVMEKEGISFREIVFEERETVFTYRDGVLGIHNHATREKFEDALGKKHSVPSILANTVEEFVEYCVIHEINHFRQETLRELTGTPYNSSRRDRITSWFQRWESYVQKIHGKENWHPSEYCKRHYKPIMYTREWFAESYLLYKYSPELIADGNIKNLLREFESL